MTTIRPYEGPLHDIPTEEEIQIRQRWLDHVMKTKRLNDLIPVIVTVAYSILLVPVPFVIGSAVGFGMGVLGYGINHLYTWLQPAQPNRLTQRNDLITYTEMYETRFRDVCIKGPIIEEIQFRLGLQGVLRYLAKRVFPTASIHLFSLKPIPLAPVVAVVLASGLFGLSHLISPRSDRKVQVYFATISGLVLGILMMNFGLAAAIGAHIANNTTSMWACILEKKWTLRNQIV